MPLKLFLTLAGSFLQGVINLYLFKRVKQVEVCRKITNLKCDTHWAKEVGGDNSQLLRVQHSG